MRPLALPVAQPTLSRNPKRGLTHRPLAPTTLLNWKVLW